MKIDELQQRLERIFAHNWDVYAESPTYLTDKAGAVADFVARLASACGKEVHCSEPGNTDNYYRLQACLTPGLPANRFTLDFDEIERAGEVVYLNVICSVVAPVAEASWHVYRIEQNQLDLKSYDLLDSAWLSLHPEWETLAIHVIQIGDETSHSVLGWEITRQLAETSWPPPIFAPESPQLRHFLFSGYYDD